MNSQPAPPRDFNKQEITQTVGTQVVLAESLKKSEELKTEPALTAPAPVSERPQPAPAPAPAPVANTSEAEAKAFIYARESGNRTDAINPSSGACGLGQALPCSKLPCTLQDYACQDNWFTNYMISRYGSWANARAFWLAHRWW